MDEPSLPRLTYPPCGPSCYSQAGHALDDHFLHKYYYIYIHSHTHLAGISICCQLLHPDRRACLQYRRSWVFTDAPEYS